MTDEEYEEQYLREVLPDWAECYDPTGTVELNRQLCTKDGRRIGNAFVTKGAGIIPSIVAIQAWEVVTDAGNVLKLTTDEINELFYIGHYIAKPNSIPGLRNLKHESE